MKNAEKGSNVPKQRFSRLAIVSVLFVVFWFLILYLLGAIAYPHSLIDLLWGIWAWVAFIGFIISIIAFVRVIRSKGVLKGGALAFICILVMFSLWSVWFFNKYFVRRSVAYRMYCGTNLCQLGKAMLIYADNHGGRYPDPNLWCDLLLQQGEVELKHFICVSGASTFIFRWPPYTGKNIWPKPEKARCSYAMNPNCRSDSSPDMALLFESKAGWNQFGGPELLNVNNHQGEGCNILFNDGHASFNKTLGLAESNWASELESK